MLRHKVIDSLIVLSYDFRLVAVSSQKKKMICKLIYSLVNLPASAESGQGNTGSSAANQGKD